MGIIIIKGGKRNKWGRVSDAVISHLILVSRKDRSYFKARGCSCLVSLFLERTNFSQTPYSLIIFWRRKGGTKQESWKLENKGARGNGKSGGIWIKRRKGRGRGEGKRGFFYCLLVLLILATPLLRGIEALLQTVVSPPSATVLLGCLASL